MTFVFGLELVFGLRPISHLISARIRAFDGQLLRKTKEYNEQGILRCAQYDRFLVHFVFARVWASHA